MLWLLLKFLIALAFIIGLILLGFILYATLTNFDPAEKETVELRSAQPEMLVPVGTNISALIWNIGYCGLGKEVDFFYDGGENVITPKNLVDKNVEGMINTLSAEKATDIILLQEVDINSKRSHYVNQLEKLQAIFQTHSIGEALNYKVKFIPIPFSKPMGRVESGLVSLSKFKSIENTRYQFPGNFAWPKSMFFLDRCFLLQRLPTENGKELIIVNTHNSAYDDGGLKKRQMEYMREILVAEYEKGNYVLVGGDWNQTPPGFDNLKFAIPNGQKAYDQIPISEDYIKGWTWHYDENIPTNRKTAMPYDPATTFTTVIDFYLCSPNINALHTTGIDLGFEFSDHQPAKLQFVLKE